MREQGIELETATLEFVQRIEALCDAESVKVALQKFISDLGFDNVCCMNVPDVGEAAADQVLMNTNPTGWVERYIERDYVRRDPMVIELFKTFQPYSWSDVLERRELSKRDKTLVFEASEFKMNAGYIVPIFGNGGYAGLASVTGERSELTPVIRAALQLVCLYAHNKLLALRRQEESTRVQLTPREAECMRWATCGKSDWEIGEISALARRRSTSISRTSNANTASRCVCRRWLRPCGKVAFCPIEPPKSNISSPETNPVLST